MGLPDDLEALLELMEELDAPFMIVGGIALEALGVPRSTLDIDVQVQLPEPPARFASDFHGWFIAERSHDDVFDQEVLILEGQATGVPVEMFLTTHWYTSQALQRHQQLTSGLLGEEIPIPTPEDFLLLKACYRSSTDRREAKATQDTLDLAYIEENANQLGIWDELEPLIE